MVVLCGSGPSLINSKRSGSNEERACSPLTCVTPVPVPGARLASWSELDSVARHSTKGEGKSLARIEAPTELSPGSRTGNLQTRFFRRFWAAFGR